MDLQIEPGERIALLGRNGAGKTTLMKVITGQLAAEEGRVIYQKGIQVAYLPQEVPLDIQGNVFDIVLSGLGDKSKLLSEYHHLSHRLQTEHTPKLIAQFNNLQAELNRTGSWDLSNQVENILTKMKLDPEDDFERLSGGQKRRVLLAKALVLKPDILLLDEPTNHLDIETLELLEELLLEFTGTLLLVSHDRSFLNNVVTSTIALEGGGIINEYPGGYDDWLRQSKNKVIDLPAAKEGIIPLKKKNLPQKLSFKEKAELEALPDLIGQLESEEKAIYALFADSSFYQRVPKKIVEAKARLITLTPIITSNN